MPSPPCMTCMLSPAHTQLHTCMFPATPHTIMTSTPRTTHATQDTRADTSMAVARLWASRAQLRCGGSSSPHPVRTAQTSFLPQ